jgi:hypothetical protein
MMAGCALRVQLFRQCFLSKLPRRPAAFFTLVL